jgi:hypothetical protein
MQSTQMRLTRHRTCQHASALPSSGETRAYQQLYLHAVATSAAFVSTGLLVARQEYEVHMQLYRLSRLLIGLSPAVVQCM